MNLRASAGLLAFAALLLFARGVGAQEIGAVVTKTGFFAGDLYVAGAQVRVLGDVEGDVIAAGGRVLVEGEVNGDVLAVGGTVDVKSRVHDDVRAAGGAVHVEASVQGDVVAAGGSVVLAPQAVVSGRVWLAGGNIEVSGRTGGELRARGGTIVIAGDIHGNADLAGDHIEMLAGASIRGHLEYESPRPARIHPEARVVGQVTQRAVAPPAAVRAPPGAAGIGVLLSLMLTGVALYLCFPAFSVRAGSRIETDPWKSLGLGMLVLLAGPLAVLLLTATVIGIPLALILLCAYPVLLLSGFLTGALYLGNLGLRWLREEADPSLGWRVGALLAALILLAVLALIPLIGALALLAVLLLGVGALKLELIHVYRSAAPRQQPRRRTRRV